MVAPLSLLQPLQVFGQSLVALPGGAVNALQLGSLLVAAPVGAGHPQESEMSEPTGGGNVGSPAEVDEGVGVPVGGDHRRPGSDISRRFLLEGGVVRNAGDYLALEGLIGEQGQTLIDGVFLAHKGLILGHDRLHARTDPLEVIVAEGGASGQSEVVIEAVGDCRTDGVLGPGPQVEHGLSQNVSGRMSENCPTGVAVARDHGHRGVVGQHGVETDLGTIHGGGHGGGGQPLADGQGHIERRRAGR